MTLDAALTARAARLVGDRARTLGLLRDVIAKAHRHRHLIKDVGADLAELAALLRAWVSGEYPRVPWRTIVMAAGALMYFVNPFDLIPDVVLFAGYLDDATVISVVAASVRRDVRNFRSWQEGVGA